MEDRTFIETLDENRGELVNFPFDVTRTFPFTPIPELEALLDPDIVYDITERKAPHYNGKEMKIHMPAREHYFCEYAFYSAALHEMAHSTKDAGVVRNFFYDQEEVVAQLVAMTLVREYRDVVWWNLDCTYLKDFLKKATIEYNRRTGQHKTFDEMRDACMVVARLVIARIRKNAKLRQAPACHG